MRQRQALVEAHNWYEKEGGKKFFENHTNKADFVGNNIKQMVLKKFPEFI